MNRIERADAGRPVSTEAIDSYCNADFGINGQAATQLLAQLENEQGAAHLVLSARIGHRPADVTERMAAWYDAYVASLRQSALDAAESIAGGQDHVKQGAGILLEREVHRREDDRIVQKRKMVTQSRESRQSKYKRLEELGEERDKKRMRYAQLRNELDRDPKIINLWFYIPFLIVVGAAEALINFETFLSIRGWTPAIATGVTMVVAIALAMSAHFWGASIRHFPVLFDPARDDKERWGQWLMMSLGTLTLSLVLGLVWYGRNSYFADILAQLLAIGGVAPNALEVIGGSMISNMVVWIVGVLASFLVHDPDPEFPRAFHEKEKATKAWDAMSDALSEPLRQAFEQIDAKTKNAIEAARKRSGSLSNIEQHNAARRQFERILAQDNNVLAVLNQYRGKLVSSVRPGTVFERSIEVYREDDDFLDSAQYAALPIRLKYV